jgi:hypothetical protein
MSLLQIIPLTPSLHHLHRLGALIGPWAWGPSKAKARPTTCSQNTRLLHRCDFKEQGCHTSRTSSQSNVAELPWLSTVRVLREARSRTPFANVSGYMPRRLLQHPGLAATKPTSLCSTGNTRTRPMCVRIQPRASAVLPGTLDFDSRTTGWLEFTHAGSPVDKGHPITHQRWTTPFCDRHQLERNLLDGHTETPRKALLTLQKCCPQKNMIVRAIHF